MSRKRIMMALVGAAAVWCAAPLAVTPAAQAGPAGAGWGQAIGVPGLGTLNSGGLAQVVSVSCASAGNCAAGGSYSERSFGDNQAFVASQRNGQWGTAIEVPGLGPLNLGGLAQVQSVSCASAGNCTAGGYTTGGSERQQAFVTSERNGRWGTAIVVPGTQALNAGGNAEVNSVSCASAGNCAAGGIYRDGFGNTQALVASQRNGRWGKAIEVPGMAALHADGGAWVWSVSCASAGNCAAGGYYTGLSGRPRAFVVGQRNGRWGKAIRVPGTGKLNAGHDAQVLSVSCPSAGNCTAGGFYTARSGGGQTFVVSERNGRWGTAIVVPGTVTVNPNAKAEVESVSCPSAGNCAAGGFYYRFGQRHAFVVSQRNRRWGKAITVPGTDSSAGGLAEVISVSCYAAGNCVAGGYYDGRFLPPGQAFLASERHGRWSTAVEVPGTAALNTGKAAEISSVSCNRTGACTAGGFYGTASNTPPYITTQGFVVSRS